MESEAQLKKAESQSFQRAETIQFETEEISCNELQLGDESPQKFFEGQSHLEKETREYDEFQVDEEKSQQTPTSTHTPLQRLVSKSLEMIRRNSVTDTLTRAPNQLSRFSEMTRNSAINEELLNHLKSLKIEGMKDTEQIEVKLTRIIKSLKFL